MQAWKVGVAYVLMVSQYLQYLELELSGKVILIKSNNTATMSYKIREDQVEAVIFIASSWQSIIPRYHLPLEMACKIPLLLPHRMDLLSQHMAVKGTLFHPDLKTFRLTA